MKDDFKMRLKELRNKKRLTLRQAAKEFGVSHVSYLRWEQGICEPNGNPLQNLRLLQCFGKLSYRNKRITLGSYWLTSGSFLLPNSIFGVFYFRMVM